MNIRGALYGATLNPTKRNGDLYNRTSPATAGAFLAKDLFKESNPYYSENDGIYITDHFLAEFRRQMSGDMAEGTSSFSPGEQKFYNEYMEYNEGLLKVGELKLALDELDSWLVLEVMNVPHRVLERNYEDSHKWRKTQLREEEKGIKWL